MRGHSEKDPGMFKHLIRNLSEIFKSTELALSEWYRKRFPTLDPKHEQLSKSVVTFKLGNG